MSPGATQPDSPVVSSATSAAGVATVATESADVVGEGSIVDSVSGSAATVGPSSPRRVISAPMPSADSAIMAMAMAATERRRDPSPSGPDVAVSGASGGRPVFACTVFAASALVAQVNCWASRWRSVLIRPVSLRR